MFFDCDISLCDYLILKNPTLWQAMGHGHMFKLIIAEKKGKGNMAINELMELSKVASRLNICESTVKNLVNHRELELVKNIVYGKASNYITVESLTAFEKRRSLNPDSYVFNKKLNKRYNLSDEEYYRLHKDDLETLKKLEPINVCSNVDYMNWKTTYPFDFRKWKLMRGENPDKWRVEKIPFVNCKTFEDENYGTFRAFKKGDEWYLSLTDMQLVLGLSVEDCTNYFNKTYIAERQYGRILQYVTHMFVKAVPFISKCTKELNQTDMVTLQKLVWIRDSLLGKKVDDKNQKDEAMSIEAPEAIGKYKLDYTYLKDCDGSYSKAIDKIETVAHYLNSANRLTNDAVVLKTVLTILGIEEEENEK